LSYFHESDSIHCKFQDEVESTLKVIAERYIGEHPKHPPVYRAFNKDGFLRNGDYRYEFDFERKFKEIQEGQYVYAWAKLWSDHSAHVRLSVSCFGPVSIFINQEQVFKSNIMDEVFPERSHGFSAKVQPGWNHFVIRFMKTGTGCGGRFGTGSIKGMPLHFLTPSAERNGQEGWIYTGPMDKPWEALPSEGQSEAETGINWLPQMEWGHKEQSMGQFARIYGAKQGAVAFAWTKLHNRLPGNGLFELRGSHHGAMTVFVNGEEIYSSKQDQSFRIPIRLSFGEQDLIIKSVCSDEKWGFSFEPLDNCLQFRQPHPVQGTEEAWLYLGTFEETAAPDMKGLCKMNTLFDGSNGAAYWQLDLPNTVVRPYMENTHYGKWNYPLGVTLYGLLQTGLELKRADYVEYVLDHIELCTSFDRYALWDKEEYGAAGINHQLSAIDTLDDCGSFASTMLEAMKQRELEGGREAADRIADYITHIQDRLPDGALYRVHGSTDFMKDTMWCDDLYMSTPFLIRYHQLTGNRAYIDDAASQFLLYKKYMFMPDQSIMSHVYDFKFDKPTRIPWGRGNGWVLFSLTELLAVLPEDHQQRDELLQFFRELCEGYLLLQGVNGLWHQVLNIPESYEETSCTSMFIYAFSRGIRFGWLSKPEPYIESVLKAWEGMTRIAIDKIGNIYGVCRGSGYSFSPLYYKDELSWNLNDTHGIGIVMLAGIEVHKMRQYLRTNENAQREE
jgi:unsaturated rhamnogalacturonyl hydrolase